MRKFRAPSKVVLLGDSGVGKSSALRSMKQLHETGTIFYDISCISSTVGIDFVSLHKNNICLNVWDTAGAERFDSITKCFMREAHICILAFDSEKSLYNCKTWYQKINTISGDCKILLIQTKSDAPNHILQTKITDMCNEVCAKRLVQVSSVTGEGISTLLSELFQIAIDQEKCNGNLIQTHQEKSTISCKICCI